MSDATAPKGPRRTQEERTATMRRRLLEATVECLVETGYANTSTNAVTKRAGVSRGALLHHFPTKQALVTTAVEHVMRRWTAEFIESVRELEATTDEKELTWEILRRLWQGIQRPLFMAWMELLVAARTDPALALAMGPVIARSHAKIDETFRVLYGFNADPDGEHAVAPRFTFLVLLGMMLERLSPDVEMEERILKSIAQVAQLGVTAAASRSGRRTDRALARVSDDDTPT